jgi:hypothetical protein
VTLVSDIEYILALPQDGFQLDPVRT